jgi:hypothetical protein
MFWSSPKFTVSKILLLLLGMAILAMASDVKLPSGRVLKNAQLGPVVFTTGLPPMLGLKYETTADIGSKNAVTAEVEEVWQKFRTEVEHQKYSNAVITVVGPASGSFLVMTRDAAEFCI